MVLSHFHPLTMVVSLRSWVTNALTNWLSPESIAPVLPPRLLALFAALAFGPLLVMQTVEQWDSFNLRCRGAIAGEWSARTIRRRVP